MSMTPDAGGTAPNRPDDAQPTDGDCRDRQAGSAGDARHAPDSDPGKELIGIEEFARLDLRIARVLEAEPHPNADRLLKLQITLGAERRQLIAGIASNYKPEDLVGRSIVVVANLKPAKLRGEVSQGMILAASDGDIVSILVPDREVEPGSSVR